MSLTAAERLDMVDLARQARFRRFLKRMIGHAGLIGAQALAGADELRAREGRRALALILIGEMAEADPTADPQTALTAALIQLLGEPAQDRGKDTANDGADDDDGYGRNG